MLDGLRQQKLVPTSKLKVHALLDAVGGKIHGGNEAVARNAIFRGMAAALGASSRRWDGIVDEDADIIAAMLREQAAMPLARSAQRPQLLGMSTSPRLPTTPPRRRPRVLLGPRVQDLVTPENHPFWPLAAEFAAEMFKEGRWDKGTKAQATQTFALFTKLLCEEGVLTIDAIEQKHFKDLKSTFAYLAKSYGNSRKDNSLSIAELKKIGASKPIEQRGLASATVRRHLSFLRCMEKQRNNEEAGITWMFTTERARAKLARAYPVTAKES